MNPDYITQYYQNNYMNPNNYPIVKSEPQIHPEVPTNDQRPSPYVPHQDESLTTNLLNNYWANRTYELIDPATIPEILRSRRFNIQQMYYDLPGNLL